jgi:hypothetical protein
MMASLINGLNAMGGAVATYAGQFGLESQKADLAQKQTILADQLATARESAGRQEAGQIAATAQGAQNTFAAGQGDLTRATQLQVAGTQAGATLGAAGIQAGASRYAADAQANALPADVRGAAWYAKASPQEQQAYSDVQSANRTPAELEMARALAGPNATRDQLQDAITTVIQGRARFTYQPTTQPDPANPGQFLSGTLKLDARGANPPEFIQTGTDPNRPGGGGMGSRSEVYFKRVAVAANEATAAAQNIMELPSGSDAGWFAGRGATHGLLGAAKETLTNAVTSQGVQDYNTILPGIARSLATIETGGLATNGSLTSSMDALTLKAGDSEITKMRKMAEIRQIVEKGMEPNLVDPRIPEPQKAQIRSIIAQIQTAIPFTHHDITVLQQSKDPQSTMADVVGTRGIGGVKPPTSSGVSPSSPALPPGFRIVE